MSTDELREMINKLYELMLNEGEAQEAHEVALNFKLTHELLAYIEKNPKQAYRAYTLYSRAIDKAILMRGYNKIKFKPGVK